MKPTTRAEVLAEAVKVRKLLEEVGKLQSETVAKLGLSGENTHNVHAYFNRMREKCKTWLKEHDYGVTLGGPSLQVRLYGVPGREGELIGHYSEAHNGYIALNHPGKVLPVSGHPHIDKFLNGLEAVAYKAWESESGNWLPLKPLEL